MDPIYTEGQTFLAARDHLHEHPHNMRRYYKQADLLEMATSLAAHSNAHEHGNLQSLLVVPRDEGGLDQLTFRRDAATGKVYLVEGELLVVEGNLRYRSGSILKAQCPPYKCELISAGQATQLLTMTIANTLRYDPDPISEGLHYARLRDEENMSVRDISKQTGIYEARITKCLRLLDLDEPIQVLIAEGKLSPDERVRSALLTVPDAKARIKLAECMASEGASIKAIVGACSNLNVALQQRERDRNRERKPQPMTGNAEGSAGRRVEDDATPVPWATVREAAATMCAQCEVKQRQLQEVQEPAWTLIAHAAEATCNNCNVRQVAGACRACPGVELLKRVIMKIKVVERTPA